jgi:hypothetical protein
MTETLPLGAPRPLSRWLPCPKAMRALTNSCSSLLVSSLPTLIKLTANHSVATPANWKDGGDCMVVPSLSDEQVFRPRETTRARARYPPLPSLRARLALALLTCLSLIQAKDKFPKGFNKIETPSGKGYLRITPQPNK